MAKAIESYKVNELLDAIGAKTPVPGGGAVAGLTAAIAAVLARMAIAFSQGHKSCAGKDEELGTALDALSRARTLFVMLGDEDAAAYEKLNAAMKTPKDSPDRAEKLSACALAAVRPPRAVLGACAGLLGQLSELAPVINRHLRSDLAIAGVLAEAAARAAWWNIQVNLPLIADPAAREQIAAEARRDLDDAAAKRTAVEEFCAG